MMLSTTFSFCQSWNGWWFIANLILICPFLTNANENRMYNDTDVVAAKLIAKPGKLAYSEYISNLFLNKEITFIWHLAVLLPSFKNKSVALYQPIWLHFRWKQLRRASNLWCGIQRLLRPHCTHREWWKSTSSNCCVSCKVWLLRLNNAGNIVAFKSFNGGVANNFSRITSRVIRAASHPR